MKTLLKVTGQILLALGAVFAVLVLLHCLDERKGNYIEIYNNETEDDNGQEEAYG